MGFFNYYCYNPLRIAGAWFSMNRYLLIWLNYNIGEYLYFGSITGELT